MHSAGSALVELPSGSLLCSGRAQHCFTVHVAEQAQGEQGSVIIGNCLHVGEFLEARIHPALVVP